MLMHKVHKYSQVALHSKRNFSQILKQFATVDPKNLGAHSKGYNLVAGEWKSASKDREIIDPMNGKVMLTQPDTQIEDA